MNDGFDILVLTNHRYNEYILSKYFYLDEFGYKQGQNKVLELKHNKDDIIDF